MCPNTAVGPGSPIVNVQDIVSASKLRALDMLDPNIKLVAAIKYPNKVAIRWLGPAK